MIRIIELSDVPSLVASGVGLVVGPAATISEQSFLECSNLLRREFADQLTQVPPKVTSSFDLADYASAVSHESEERVRQTVAKYFKTTRASIQLSHLVRGRWVAAVCLSPDKHFAKELRTYFDGLPLEKTVTLISSLSIVPSPRSVAVYQLLGDVDGLTDSDRLV